MKKMRITAFLLAAFMTASILASCGANEETSSESSVVSELDTSSEESSAELESSEATESSEDAESSQGESAEPTEESSAPESSVEVSKPTSSNTSSSKPASKPTSKPSTGGNTASSQAPTESSTQSPPPGQSVDTSDTTPEGAEMSLSSIMDSLYEGISEENMPMVMNTTLSSENSEYYVGVPSSSYTEGLASDSAIGSIAHSVCLLRAADADKAAALAKDVKEKANPRKWVCVEAEKVIVKQKGDLVLLIMTSADKADTISANFDNLSV